MSDSLGLKINIRDLPFSKFKVSMKTQAMFDLINEASVRGNQLYTTLSEAKSQKDKKLSSIKSSFLLSWKYGKRIPLDCLEKFCILANRSLEDYQKFIYEICSGSSYNNWAIRFPIALDESLFIVSEAIRTEGFIMREHFQGFSITNKDVMLLRRIEKELKAINLEESCFSRMLHIYIYLNSPEQIKSIENRRTRKQINFCFNDNRVIFLEQIKNFSVDNEYLIYFKGGAKRSIKVKTSKDNVLFTKSRVKTAVFATLQVYNSVFAKFLHHVMRIPAGIGSKKSYLIDFPFDINKLDDSVIKAILSIVLSCEGCVFYDPARKERVVRVKLASKKYIEKLKFMFNKLGISCKTFNTSDGLYSLDIRRRENFRKLYAQINLIVLYKQQILEKILKSYSTNRFTHFEAGETYLKFLKKYGPINAKELSEIIKRDSESVRSALNSLCNRGLAERYGRNHTGKGSTPWIYIASQLAKKTATCV